jgi:macrolide transport system ATP-binding/permease protein
MSKDKADVLMRLSELHRHYPMGESTVRALDGVDLEIYRGEFVTIVGSSGSGKSTLMHILGCLDSPSSGEYELSGVMASRLDDRELSQLRNARIGFVFQQFNLLPNLTVLENIAVPLVYRGTHRRERLERARKYGGLAGLGDRLTHRPGELSGGQRQRVAIARALVNEPDIIFADEPTGNLDSRTGQEIMDLLFDLNARGYTVIMVTHDPELADQGTRKITIRDGRVVADAAGARKPGVKPAAAFTHPGGGGMGLKDLLRTGVREGLLAHKMRSALTMLGIVIGVAGVVSMSSFSLGSKRKQADQIRALGANLVRVVDARLEGEKLARARMGGSRGLSLVDVDYIRAQVPEVVSGVAVRELRANVLDGDHVLQARVMGVQGDYLKVNNMTLSDGRFLDQHDEATASRVVVLGSALADEMGGNPLGRTLLIGGTPHEVVGVLASRSVDIEGLEASGAQDPNGALLMPLGTVMGRTRELDMRSPIDEIQLQLSSEDALYRAGTMIRRLLIATHGGEEDFRLVIPLELLKQKQQSQRLLDILTACVSSVSLIVGGIGIMNIMLASVTERIREIGIRRAVGATQLDIKLQFLSEAILISITGGVVGVGAALLTVIATCRLLELPVVVSTLMVVVSVVAAMVTGLVFGLYPAAQAAAKEPVEALRYE